VESVYLLACGSPGRELD